MKQIDVTSDLSKDEFESRLKDLTTEGEPLIMGSPFAIFTIFGNTSKPFLGELDKSQFRLTRNSVWPFNHSAFTIKGNYSSAEDGGSQVKYEVKPMWFVYIGARLIPLLFILFVNTVLYLNKISDLSPYVISSVFLLGIFFIAIKLESVAKNRFERRFQQEFRLSKYQ